MSSALTAANGSTAPILPADVEKVLIQGDLSALKPEQRVAYYNKVCESLGLNPLTQPFDYIRFQGKERLYAKRDATDQLRSIYRVSVRITGREVVDGVLVVTATATMPDGRTDEAIGALNVQGLRGDNLAIAQMKAETKAKRRVTLSICGLGWLDESEVIEGERADLEPVEPPKRTTKTLAQIKADATKPPATAVDFDAQAHAIAESTPPPAGYEPPAQEPAASAEPVKPGPLEPDVPAEEWRLVADELIERLGKVKHQRHLENWRSKHAQEMASLKANAPAEYERVVAAGKAAAERVG